MTVKNVRLKNQSGEQLIPDVGIPSQSGNNGKVLGTNGSNLVWVTQQGGGGGGSSYTAGDGIIIENDVISADGVQTNEVDTETVSLATLATVATSGSYADLSNTPTVDQTYNAQSTNAQSGVALASVIGNIEALLANI